MPALFISLPGFLHRRPPPLRGDLPAHRLPPPEVDGFGQMAGEARLPAPPDVLVSPEPTQRDPRDGTPGAALRINSRPLPSGRPRSLMSRSRSSAPATSKAAARLPAVRAVWPRWCKRRALTAEVARSPRIEGTKRPERVPKSRVELTPDFQSSPLSDPGKSEGYRHEGHGTVSPVGNDQTSAGGGAGPYPLTNPPVTRAGGPFVSFPPPASIISVMYTLIIIASVGEALSRPRIHQLRSSPLRLGYVGFEGADEDGREGPILRRLGQQMGNVHGPLPSPEDGPSLAW